MGSGKSLIGGTNDSEERIYPPYWPCKLCDKPFEKHLKIGELYSYFNVHALRNWCYRPCEGNAAANSMGYYFTPIDNLTYIERLTDGKLPR